MNKQYVFKFYKEGDGKNGPYKMLELHDSSTLENTMYFLPREKVLPVCNTLQLKDRVEVEHGISNYNGKPVLTIEAIKKIV